MRVLLEYRGYGRLPDRLAEVWLYFIRRAWLQVNLQIVVMYLSYE